VQVTASGVEVAWAESVCQQLEESMSGVVGRPIFADAGRCRL
jgi:hypothetical protein